MSTKDSKIGQGGSILANPATTIKPTQGPILQPKCPYCRNNLDMVSHLRQDIGEPTELIVIFCGRCGNVLGAQFL